MRFSKFNINIKNFYSKDINILGMSMFSKFLNFIFICTVIPILFTVTKLILINQSSSPMLMVVAHDVSTSANSKEQLHKEYCRIYQSIHKPGDTETVVKISEKSEDFYRRKIKNNLDFETCDDNLYFQKKEINRQSKFPELTWKYISTKNQNFRINKNTYFPIFITTINVIEENSNQIKIDSIDYQKLSGLAEKIVQSSGEFVLICPEECLQINVQTSISKYPSAEICTFYNTYICVSSPSSIFGYSTTFLISI